MPVSAEFRKGLKNNKSAKKRFDKAKEARPGSGFDAPDIPKGNYILKIIGVDAVKNGRGNLEAAIAYKIMKGEHAGTCWKQRYELEGTEEQAEFVDKAWEGLSKSIQVLLDMGEEELEGFQNWDTDDLCDILDEVHNNGSIIKAYLSPWESKSGQRNLSMYPSSIIPDDEIEDAELDIDPDDEEAGEEEEEQEEAKPARGKSGKKPAPKTSTRSSRKKQEEEEEEEEEEQEEEAEEEEEESEDEDAPEILKGNFVYYKPKGSRKEVECEVMSSNRAKEECTLKNVDDPKKKYSAVPWDACTLIEEE